MVFVLAACGGKSEGTSEPTPQPVSIADAAPVAIDAGVPDAVQLPDEPTQGEIDAAMEKIRSRVMGCNRAGFTGTIIVIIDVFHYGKIDKVQIKGAPDVQLAECIARIANRAKFGRSKHGGRVSYPFEFE